MKGAYLTGTIRAEIKRAHKVRQSIDRLHLLHETGLKWNQLSDRIDALMKGAIAELANPKGAR